jgi:translation elongation factor EF-4
LASGSSTVTAALFSTELLTFCPLSRKNELVKLEVRINSEPADPLAVVCHRDSAYKIGKALVHKLKELIPRQMFK